MAEIIRTWLCSRLGVIIDLSPKIFGRYCRDGTFLAKILHSYDIINDSQLQTITQTSDPALARINLRHLRCWLRFIGVDCDNTCIEDISNGKGTASLRLFYKLFLCLENKDRLHFITLQKEREKYIPNSTKFDVKVVSEELPIESLPDHPLVALSAKDTASLTNWYKKKFQTIIEDCKLEREKFRASQASNDLLKKPILNKFSVVHAKDTLKKCEMEELDEFTEKHRVKSSIDCQLVLNMTEKSKQLSNDTNAFRDPEAAKQFMKTLKKRKSSMNATQNFKVEMQKTLLSNVWDKMAGDQERKFDRIIAKKILDQSQYEKQMVKKLCDIRNQKNQMASNRKLVDELMMNTQETELRMMEETVRENKIRENEEVDDECRRMNELHERIKLAKRRRMDRKLQQLTMKIVRDIVDISVNAAEFKRANDNFIPVRIWNEWKTLFQKTLPVFESTNNFTDYREYEYEDDDTKIEDFADVELTEKNILNECDFENYHNIKSPWNEFMPELDNEIQEYLRLGSTVVGYIVHKLLQIVYPRPPKPMKPPLPDVKIRTVIIGIPDISYFSSLHEQLKHKKIQLFTVHDAINYCLHCFKEEMKEFGYIDINIENESSKKLSDTLTTDEKRKLKKHKREKRKLGKMSNKKAASLLKTSNNIIDKETQTPKVIPYDDTHPQLSDTAYVGKWTHEILTHGEPMSDDLTAKIIVEYIKSLHNIHGWVLLNYPKTYQQMSHLEFLFTGRKIESPDKLNQLNSIDMTIDEMDSRPSRITFPLEDNDSCASCRESELLPNPLRHTETSTMATYLTSFIRVLPKPKNIINVNEEELLELQPEDATNLDRFYAYEGVASAIYYTTFSISTLKRVAKLIIGERSSPRISLVELSGNASMNYPNSGSKNNKNKTSIPKAQIETSSRIVIESATPHSEVEIEQMETKSHLAKPGELEWTWINFNLAPNIIEDLATLWENLEEVYIEGLKEILALKRSKFIGVVSYKDFIIQHMTEFIARPDNKQKLLRQFQFAFNDIAADMRDDEDVKCELHCRVDDFQVELWEICDSRRREAEEERKRIMNDYWTPMEIIILINIYIGIIQLEIDRFIDTVQLIQNYYSSMLKRSTDEIKLSKFTLHRFILDADNPNARDFLSPISITNENVSSKDDDKIPIKEPPLPGVNESDLKHEINNILLSINEITKNDVTQTFCFKIIQANINYVQSIIDNVYQSISETLQKESNAPLSRYSSDRKGKKRMSKRLSERSNRSEQRRLEHQKIRNLLQEWKYGLMFEVNRIRMRLLILEAAKNSDIEFLLGSIQRAFVSIHQILNDKYEKEVKTVNNITKLFSLAIETEISIQKEVILNGDDISSHSYFLLYPDKVEHELNCTRDESEDLLFTISQLGRLKDIFQRVAPSAIISERSFAYILQDLIACADESFDITPLPASWYKLKPDDIVELLHELFGDVRYIDWREFLIYAMELQMPSQDDLLDVKEAFANKSSDSTGIIHREQFILQPLWFPSSLQFSSLKSMLHENVEKDEREMFEEEFDVRSWPTTFGMSKQLKKPKKSISFWSNGSKELDSESDIKLQEGQSMRMALIKELLCEMYLNSYYTVNYIALLLAFCKDDDPVDGFGKALSIALGKRVCSDFSEGEKYVSELLEEKQLSADEQTQRLYQRKHAIQCSEELLMELVDRAIEFGDRVLINIEDMSLIRIDNTLRESGPILIEKLDQPGETIDPATLFIAETPLPINSYCDGTDLYKSIDESGESSSSLQSNELIIAPKEREMVYWLPINVCESVLSALLPPDVIQHNIFNTRMSFIENLRQIYRDVECKELNNAMDDAALAHRVVHHPFIIQLLQCTMKFTSKHLTNIVEKVLNNKLSSG